MDNILFVSIFCLLIVAHGTSGSNLSDDFAILAMLDDLDIEEGEEAEAELFDLPSWTSERGSKVLVNVDGYGAKGDGVSDDTQVTIL